MKIAIISLASRIGGKTGDCVQADKTAHALARAGNDVLRCYLSGDQVLDVHGRALGSWAEVLGECKIVHAIPPIPWTYIKNLPKINAKLVSSTVFWRSWTYIRTIHKVHGRLSIMLIKEYLHCILAWAHIRSYFSYKGYDLLLANSEDEIRTFCRYCVIKEGARIMSVPNAVDPIPNYVINLPRTQDIPETDYVIVPAVFAERKNHFTLIEALKHFPHKVVFMGDGECLEECRRRATANMLFLGHVEHGSAQFYTLLKYAKVCVLPSNCETPGIAGLEAAALGARPVVPNEGGTTQYYAWDAEYHNSLSPDKMREAIAVAWERGRLNKVERERYELLTWDICAKNTSSAYDSVV